MPAPIPLTGASAQPPRLLDLVRQVAQARFGPAGYPVARCQQFWKPAAGQHAP
jgi:hypothetical protein